jgi:hypothetical protein
MRRTSVLHAPLPCCGFSAKIRPVPNVPQMTPQTIFTIRPYRDGGLWVFDDAERGLDREPLIAGADKLLERLVAARGIRDAERGFRLRFSDRPFRGAVHLLWRRHEQDGDVYYSENFDAEGWLCPALRKYYPQAAPRHLYAAAHSRVQKRNEPERIGRPVHA